MLLFTLLWLYVKSALVLYILFALFNAVVGQVGFNLEALKLGEPENKIVLITPAAYVIIALIFGGGFFGSILSIGAFVLIYAYFTGKIKL